MCSVGSRPSTVGGASSTIGGCGDGWLHGCRGEERREKAQREGTDAEQLRGYGWAELLRVSLAVDETRAGVKKERQLVVGIEWAGRHDGRGRGVEMDPPHLSQRGGATSFHFVLDDEGSVHVCETAE